MWELDKEVSGYTTKVTIPADGVVSITKPYGVKVSAFVNGMPSAIHHIHVKAGDVVHFKMKNKNSTTETVGLQYGDDSSYLEVEPSETGVVSAADYKEEKMTGLEGVNLFANPNAGMGGALGGGLGAGLVGGLLGTMLFRNGALGNTVDGAVPATLSGVESVVNNAAITQALGDIKASIPFNEGQVQLALAGAKAGIVSEISSQTNAIVNNQNRDALAMAAGFSSVNGNVLKTAADNQLAITTAAAATNKAIADAATLAERNAWAITQAITNDGDRTRSLIQSIDKTNDSRLITSQANEITELRHDRRLGEAVGNITISNNNAATANAQQQQGQQQQQLQYQILAQLAALNADVQSVKQSSVVFNSGTQTNSGNQGAANTRVA